MNAGGFTSLEVSLPTRGSAWAAIEARAGI